MTETIETLNAQLGLPVQLSFGPGPSGLPLALITNAQATATVALQGAQLLAFQPHGEQPVLWVSSHANYLPGKAIRGGVPICWPWFGPHPSDPTLPQHGFARTSIWTPILSTARDDGATELQLALRDSAATRALWPHAFAILLTISVGSVLQLSLDIHNTGDEPFVSSGAFHSYFAVGDATALRVEGLDGHHYFDQLDGQTRQQHGPVLISGETDRVYRDAPGPLTIVDPLLGRHIRIDSAGSDSAVVWNPWIEKAQRMADFGDDEYRAMLCVETANARDDARTLAPGNSHLLEARISTTPGA